MKKRIALFFALLIAISAFCLFSFGTYAAEGDFTYTVYGGKATVTGASSTLAGNVTIPDTLGGYPVTAIGSYAFNNMSSVSSFTLPEGLASIGNYAFSNCTSLAQINIPSTLKSIGSNAFMYCENIKRVYITDLKAWCETSIPTYNSSPLYFPGTSLYLNGSVLSGKITVPDGTTKITAHAFANCSLITEISIPESVTEIWQYAFINCHSMKNINIPNGVKVIPISAFEYCRALTEIKLHDGITKISDYAFFGCTSIKNVDIPQTVTAIGIGAFGDCTSLESIHIPPTVSVIEDYAFFACTSLKEIVIPSSVSVIDSSAFEESALTSVEIPESVIYIGECAFRNCPLDNVKIHGSPDIMADAFAYTYTSTTVGSIILYQPPALITDSKATISPRYTLHYVASDTVTSAYAQKYNRTVILLHGRESCTFNVETPSAAALKTRGSCEKKAVYYLSCQCGRISKNDTFEVFQHTFTAQIPEDAYLHSSDPSTLSVVYYYACRYCGEKGENTYTVSADLTKRQENGYTYIIFDGKAYITKANSLSVRGSVTVPATLGGYPVGGINESAFAGNTGITSVILPDSLTSIGKKAFYDCANLASVTFLSRDTKIAYDQNAIHGDATIKCYKENASVIAYAKRFGRKLTIMPCSPDGCVFNREVISDEYLISPASATQKAVYAKSCLCGKASPTDRFEYLAISVVYVKDGGTGIGISPDTAAPTMEEAFASLDLSRDCTVVICGPYTQTDTFTWGSSFTGSVTFTSVYEGTDYRASANAAWRTGGYRHIMWGKTVFDNIKFELLEDYYYIVAQCNPITLGRNVDMSSVSPNWDGLKFHRAFAILGGYQGAQGSPELYSEKNISITVLSGKNILVGAYNRHLDNGHHSGKAIITLGGNAHVAKLYTCSVNKNYISCGDVELTVKDNATLDYIYGAVVPNFNVVVNSLRVHWQGGTIKCCTPHDGSGEGTEPFYMRTSYTEGKHLIYNQTTKNSPYFNAVITAFDTATEIDDNKEENVIFVADNGNDMHSGTKNYPVKTLQKAASLLSEAGGTIVVVGVTTVNTENSVMPMTSGHILVTSVYGGADYRDKRFGTDAVGARLMLRNGDSAALCLRGDYTFDDIVFCIPDSECRKSLIAGHYNNVTFGTGLSTVYENEQGVEWFNGEYSDSVVTRYYPPIFISGQNRSDVGNEGGALITKDHTVNIHGGDWQSVRLGDRDVPERNTFGGKAVMNVTGGRYTMFTSKYRNADSNLCVMAGYQISSAETAEYTVNITGGIFYGSVSAFGTVGSITSGNAVQNGTVYLNITGGIFTKTFEDDHSFIIPLQYDQGVSHDLTYGKNSKVVINIDSQAINYGALNKITVYYVANGPEVELNVTKADSRLITDGYTVTYGELNLPEAPEHDHILSNEWTVENGEHYKVCTVAGCMHKADKAACNTSSTSCNEDASCIVCGKEYPGTDHTMGTEWYCKSDTHYRKCIKCGETGETAEHSYGADDICTECGYLKGSGVEVTVKVTSFGEESASVLAELIPEGDSTPAYSAEGASSEDIVFEAIVPGNYILRVSKTKHVTREYKVTVGEEDTVEVLLRLYGDVDNNGKINAADATQIKRYYNNKTSVFDSVSGEELEYLQKAADVNGDNKANASDATQIKRFYNNKTSVFSNIE